MIVVTRGDTEKYRRQLQKENEDWRITAKNQSCFKILKRDWLSPARKSAYAAYLCNRKVPVMSASFRRAFRQI